MLQSQGGAVDQCFGQALIWQEGISWSMTRLQHGWSFTAMPGWLRRFYSDVTREFTISLFEQGVSLPVIEQFIAEGRINLEPTT
jgi:hypothetical protein